MKRLDKYRLIILIGENIEKGRCIMEQLLEMAKKVCDQAEVYVVERSSSSVSFENAKLHDIDSKIQSGLSLRIIKDGKLGFAYTETSSIARNFYKTRLIR